MVKRMVIMLVAMGILFGGIFGYQAFMGMMMKKYMFSGEVPPVTVTTAKAEMMSWQPKIRAVGSFRAARGVDVSSEAAGQVEAVFFKSGEQVAAGKLLLMLNTDIDKAQLRALEVAAELSRTIYERDMKQLEVQAVSQAVVDADAAEWKSRRAQVDQEKALIAKKFIRAPFAGRVGITSVNRGQYLNPGEKIVTLQALEVLYLDFFVPQQDLARLALGQAVDLTVDTYPGKTFTGLISAVNPKVEADSRNIQLQVTVNNPDGKLLPGMFATAEVLAGEPEQLLTVPQTAVAFNPYGETVFVVNEDGKDAEGKPQLKVKQVFVAVDGTRGDQVSILKGVKAGDTVVTTGQLKLQNGSKIVINNQVQPSNDAAPQPVDQ